MKFICLSVKNKTYKVAESDIKKIHFKKLNKRPSLPQYE